MGYRADTPATLYRAGGSDPAHSPLEEIGSGRLAKMIRIALSDPDGEVWRYSIAAAGNRMTEAEFVDLAAEFGIPRAGRTFDAPATRQ